MAEFLLILEGRNAAHHYHLLVEDILLRRLGARRLLRSAFVVEAESCEDVYDRIRTWTPCTDGVIVVPYPAQRFERNLRGAATIQAVVGAPPAMPVGDQPTPD